MFKEFPNNPRNITDQDIENLGESLAEFGSLDGFVVNRSDGKYKDCIVSGNQKNKKVRLGKTNITIEKLFDEPTAAGTVAVGFVTYKGERFPYREVHWSERKCEIANLRANNYGGKNNAELLSGFDSEVLALGGVDLEFEKQLEKIRKQLDESGIEKMKEGEEVLLDQAIQLKPPREYVLIMCSENGNEWEQLQLKLGLKPVRRGGYKKGSAFDAVGTQRIINAKELLDLLK